MNNSKKALIMLNDSDPVLSRVCKIKFKKEIGWETIISSNYNQAIELIKKEKPGLVLTDIILADSKENGFDLLKYIKSSEDKNISNAKVIIFTELRQEEDKKKAKELGADDYYVKSNMAISEVIEKLKTMV